MTLVLKNPELLHGAVAVAGNGMLGFLRQMAVGTATTNAQGVSEYQDAETVLNRKIELKKGTAAPVFADETAEIFWNTTNDDIYLRGTSTYVLVLDQSDIGTGGGSSLGKGAAAPVFGTNTEDIYWNTTNNDVYFRGTTNYVKIIDQSETTVATGTIAPVFANETAPIYWNTSTDDFYLRGTSSYELIIDQSTLGTIATGTSAPVFANETARIFWDTSTNNIYLRGISSYTLIKEQKQEIIYTRSITVPSKPSGGSWDLNTFTPPTNWSNISNQRFVPSSTNTIARPNIPANIRTLAALDKNASANIVYWLDSTRNSIYLTTRDGTNTGRNYFSISGGGANPIGVAADSVGSIHVSYANPSGTNGIKIYNGLGNLQSFTETPVNYQGALAFASVNSQDILYIAQNVSGENQLTAFNTTSNTDIGTPVILPSGTVKDLALYQGSIIVLYSNGRILFYTTGRVAEPEKTILLQNITNPVAIASDGTDLIIGTDTTTYRTTISNANLYYSVTTLPSTATTPVYSDPFLLLQNINPVRIIYQRSSTSLSTRPSGGSWDGSVFTPPNDWTIGVPDGSDALYGVTTTLGTDGTTITYSIPFLIGGAATVAATPWTLTYGLYNRAGAGTKVGTALTSSLSHTPGSHTVNITFPATTTAGPDWYFELPSNITFNHIYNIGTGRSLADSEWTLKSGSNPPLRSRTNVFPGATGHYEIDITVT